MPRPLVVSSTGAADACAADSGGNDIGFVQLFTKLQDILASQRRIEHLTGNDVGHARLLTDLQEVLAGQRRIEQELAGLSSTQRDLMVGLGLGKAVPELRPRCVSAVDAMTPASDHEIMAESYVHKREDLPLCVGSMAMGVGSRASELNNVEATESSRPSQGVASRASEQVRVSDISKRTGSRRPTFSLDLNASIDDILTHGISRSMRKGFVQRVAESDWFGAVTCAIIVFNVIVLAFESEHRGLMLEPELARATGSEGPSNQAAWPGAEQAFDALEWLFGVAFWLEFLIRLCGLRLKFFNRIQGWIDMSVVICWTIGKAASASPFNVQAGRIVRLMRLTRLLKLVRVFAFFDALFVINHAIMGSLMSLMWFAFVLTLVLAFCSLVLNEVLYQYYFRSEAASKRDSELWTMFLYFGTFTRSLFSMYELALANWPPIGRLLSEEVSQWFMMITVGHKLVIGVAMVGVINAIFIQETFACVNLDDTIMVRQKLRYSLSHRRKMQRLFKMADTNENGFVSLSEFQAILAYNEVATWLSAMGFDSSDVKLTFDMIAGDDGRITEEELVNGVERLKGPARSIDLLRFSVDQEPRRSQVHNA